MSTVEFEISAFLAMRERLEHSEDKSISVDEWLAAAIFFLCAVDSDPLIGDEPIEEPSAVRGWIRLSAQAEMFRVSQSEIWTGLQECAARGVLVVAGCVWDPDLVFAELMIDPKHNKDAGAMSDLKGALKILDTGRDFRLDRPLARVARERLLRMAAREKVKP